MELKEFIKTAIKDITEAVMEADKELSDSVSLCVHTNGAYHGYPSISYKHMREMQLPLTVIDFKVKVSVEDGMKTVGNAKASALNVVGGGISGELSQTSETTQELSFSIPMVWKRRRE